MSDSPYLPLYFGHELVGDLVKDGSGKIHFEANVNANVEFPETSKDMLIFLENLLPEGTRQEWYIALRRLKSPDLFGWLKEYGSDNIGFVHTYGNNDSLEFAKDITKEVYELVGKRQPIIFVKQKSLLPGVDLKIAILFKDNKFYIPGKNGFSSHILKYGNELCLNETFCLSLMQACGIEAAVPKLLCINGQEALLSERFDRKIIDNKIIALDQRDFCQELKIMSRFKYSIRHEQIASLLSNFNINPKKFLSIQIFNIIMGANDDHGKNFSLLRNGETKLAPAYDVASMTVAKKVSLIYKNIFLKLSRPIGNQEFASKLKPAHFFQLADIYNVDKEWICEELGRIAFEIKNKSDFLLNEFASFSDKEKFDEPTKTLHQKTLEHFSKLIPVQSERFLDLTNRAMDKLNSYESLKP